MAEDAEPPAKRAKGEEKVEEEQPVLSARPNVVRLPGREVNAQRARLWQQLGSNALLFDVTLKASDRDVPCNRCGPLSWFCLRASCAGRMPPTNPPLPTIPMLAGHMHAIAFTADAEKAHTHPLQFSCWGCTPCSMQSHRTTAHP